MSMENVRHAVHENTPRPFPVERKIKALIPEPRRERVSAINGRILDWRLLKVKISRLLFGDGHRVAMVPARRDHCAACHWVPRRVGPLYSRLLTHADRLALLVGRAEAFFRTQS